MNIGVIGAGSIAQTYAKLWASSGHSVVISSRKAGTSPEAPAGVPEEIRLTTPSKAAEFGDVILLAVNYGSLDEAIESIRVHVTNKLVIDATNPLVYAEGGGTKRVLPENEIAGLVMAKKLPEARIGKAFTSLWTKYVQEHASPNAPKIAMPYAADTEADRDTLADLISDAGLVPVNLGTLAQSRPLDPPSAVWNQVLTPEEFRTKLSQQ